MKIFDAFLKKQINNKSELIEVLKDSASNNIIEKLFFFSKLGLLASFQNFGLIFLIERIKNFFHFSIYNILNIFLLEIFIYKLKFC